MKEKFRVVFTGVKVFETGLSKRTLTTEEDLRFCKRNMNTVPYYKRRHRKNIKGITYRISSRPWHRLSTMIEVDVLDETKTESTF